MKRRTFLQLLGGLPFVALPSISLAKPKPTNTVTLVNPSSSTELLYLEVSARRSGKTTRLIKHMCDYIDQTGKSVYFTSGSHSMTHYILEEYLPYPYHPAVIPLMTEQDMLRKAGFDIDYSRRFYYDEADLVNDKYLHINNNAYYVGTPHSGNLKKLADMNNGKYFKYSYNGDFSIIEECKTKMDDKAFKREFFGEFV